MTKITPTIEPTIEEKIQELKLAGWKRGNYRPGYWVSRSGLYYASPSWAWVLMKRSVEGVLSGLKRAMDD